MYFPSVISFGVFAAFGVFAVAARDYFHIGCYRDTVPRALQYGPGGSGFTVESCLDTCEALGSDYRYFALQNGGQCFCGQDFADATQYGEATDSNEYHCDGTGLGGPWANDLYMIADSDAVAVRDSLHIGCYRDTIPRALQYGAGSGFTVESCLDTCDASDYLYFALQNGGECFCDRDFDDATQYGEATDSNEYHCDGTGLGGPWANDLYQVVARDYLHIGCYRDTVPRALQYGPISSGFTIESCLDTCEALGSEYRYFALQNGGACFCGQDFADATQYGEATDSNEYHCHETGLGGPWANDLYINLGPTIATGSNVVPVVPVAPMAPVQVPLGGAGAADVWEFGIGIGRDQLLALLTVITFILAVVNCWMLKRSKSGMAKGKPRYRNVSMRSYSDSEVSEV